MEFSLERLWNLIKRDFVQNSKIYIYWFGIITIISSLLLFTPTTNVGFAGTIIIVFVAIWSFRDFQTISFRRQYLVLPASNLEKYISNVIITFIILPLIVLVGVIFGLLLNKAFGYLLSDTGIYYNNELNLRILFLDFLDSYIRNIPFLIVLFMGNAFFNKMGSLKMLMIMIGVGIGILLINLSLWRMITSEITMGIAFILKDFPDYIKTITAVIISTFFLWLSYLRLTEKEG